MNAPLLVRGSLRRWDITLLVVAGGALLVLAYWLQDVHQAEGAVIVGAVGGLVILAAVALAFRRARHWQTVEIEPEGFLLRDPQGERSFRDEQITSAAVKVTPNYMNGNLKSHTRWLHLWIASPGVVEEKLVMRNKMAVHEQDPLGAFVSRVCDRLVAEARHSLTVGGKLQAPAWTLTRDVLEIAAEPEPLSTRLEAIAAVETVDQHLAVWRAGDEAAWARIPLDAANAFVLSTLLSEAISERGSAAPPPAGSGLGRLIFERRPKRWHVGLLAGSAIALLVAAAALLDLVIRPPKAGDVMPWWMPLLTAIGALPFIVGMMHAIRRTFRCHERGVLFSGLTGQRALMYDEVEAFTFSATRMYHNGAYVGTNVSLSLEPGPNGPRAIRYSTSIANEDEMLDRLRDQIANVVGRKMHERVLAGQAVSWTRRLRFEGGSLVHSPKGWFGRKPAMAYPLAALRTYEFREGHCYLYVIDAPQPVMKESTSARNFFPGFVCLAMFMRRQAEEPT